MEKNSLSYEGVLDLADGYRVVVVRIDRADRCFPVGPNGHPLARTGYPSIDEAKQQIAAFRAQGRSPDVDSLPPSALPPHRRLPLEPVMDTVMRVEIRGIYVALLGIIVGGEALMWILQLPARYGARTTKIYRDETQAVDAFEQLCVELSARFINTQLGADNEG